MSMATLVSSSSVLRFCISESSFTSRLQHRVKSLESRKSTLIPCSSLLQSTASESQVPSNRKPGKFVRKEQAQVAQTKTQRESARTFNRRDVMLSSIGTIGAGILCPCCKAAESWTYGGPCGPRDWGGVCVTGVQQSPVDIQVNKLQGGEALGELIFDYRNSVPSFYNTGHGTMQVNFVPGENKLRYKGRELDLMQFHFHSPSEHAFNGLRYPMEAHLVHRDVDNNYAVIGVMLGATPKTKPNEALAAALRFSPSKHGTTTTPNVTLTAASLLPPLQKSSRRYMHYPGSFTTPPCSESVDWFLLEKPLDVGVSQILEFMEYVGDEVTLALNARPIQPLGSRIIFKGP